MIPDPEKAARDLLRFYAEAGVDALVGEEPVDRFAEPAAAQKETPAPPAERVPAAAAARDPAPATAAPPPTDQAVMAAREAAKNAATLDELRAIMTVSRAAPCAQPQNASFSRTEIRKRA
jgi:DNA polymerase